ncbi:hypothetical protein YC2023_016805 [Brassica napus]
MESAENSPFACSIWNQEIYPLYDDYHDGVTVEAPPILFVTSSMPVKSVEIIKYNFLVQSLSIREYIVIEAIAHFHKQNPPGDKKVILGMLAFP